MNIGQDNFDEIEYIYFRDANVVLEAFKGDQYDYRLENSSKDWATAYDFPALKDGRCIKEEIHTQASGRHAELCPQPAPGKIPGCAGAQGVESMP